jgi:hypothetical protein
MFTQRISLSQQDARQVSANQLHKLGTVAETADGRIFRYASAGAVALVAGAVNVTPAAAANHTNIAVAAAAVGARQVTVTVGATAVTQDQYKDGFLAVIDVAGQGGLYRITGNAAIASSGTGVIYLEEAVATALTASSKVSLVPSVYGASIVAPGSGTAFFSNGTNNVAVAASSFYWSQTGGLATVLADATPPTKGTGAILSSATAGAVSLETATHVGQRIAIAPETAVSAKYYPVNLVLE